MAYYDTVWYVSSVGYSAVPQWAASTAITAGTLRRQLAAPAIGNERVFVCTTAGTTGTAEPAWVVTRGARSPTGSGLDGSVVWFECTGAAVINGDSVNMVNWTTVKNNNLGNPSLGATILDQQAGTSIQLCTTAGTMMTGTTGPTFSTTPGATTTDGSVTWTCIGSTTSAVDWAAPHARLPNAMATNWGAGGNDFYIADNSAETSTAGISLGAGAGIGTISTGSRVFSIDHTAVLPAVSANLKPGASITSSLSGAGAISIGAVQSSAYMYGLTFVATAAYTSAALMQIANSTGGRHRFENCTFSLTGGASGSVIQMLNQSAQIELINCTYNLTNAGQVVSMYGGSFAWRNTPDPVFPGTVPTLALRGANTSACLVLFEGLDFTSLGANSLISGAIAGAYVTIKNCKLHTGPIVGTESTAFSGSNVDVINSDSGAGVYRNERHNVFGDLTTSTTVYRTGGAQDGTTSVSHYVVTNAYPKSWRPFECLPLVIWNDLVGATRTITVCGYVPGASAPLPYNDQFWFDVEYMGSTATPVGSFVSSGLPNQLAAHTVIAVADSSTWVGAPAGTAFALSITLTAQQHGYLTIYPRVGTSYTLYLDPKPVLS